MIYSRPMTLSTKNIKNIFLILLMIVELSVIGKAQFHGYSPRYLGIIAMVPASRAILGNPKINPSWPQENSSLGPSTCHGRVLPIYLLTLVL